MSSTPHTEPIGESARLEAARLRTFAETNAQGVFGNLRQLRAALPVHRRRWIWELLQNAADAANPESGENSVCIEVGAGSLRFSHNGAAFNSDQITHLIYHGSTKQGEQSGKIRFGTGFLTIHLVSQKVSVSGIWENEGKNTPFSFRLDRGGETATEVGQKMDSAWAEFVESVRHRTAEPRTFTTVFECEITPEAEASIREGLADLTTAVPYVLGFVPALAEVIVKNGDENYRWTRKGCPDSDAIEISAETPRGISPLRLARFGDHVAGIAIAVLLNQEGQAWHVMADYQTPKLFYPFPLVDTHDFPVPYVIVSNSIEAPEARNGILLNAPPGADKATDKNWVLLKEILPLFESMIRRAVAENWSAIHRLAAFSKPSVREWLDLGRLVSEILVPSIAFLRGSDAPPMVVGLEGSPITLSISAIPVGVSPWELFTLTSELRDFRARIPSSSEALIWAQILDKWSALLDRPVGGFDETMTIEKLGDFAASKSTLTRISEAQDSGTVESAIAWLNRLLAIVPSDAVRTFVQLRPILPNQEGTLKKDSDLRLDHEISETIKDVCEGLGEPIRAELLHRNILSGIQNTFATQKGKTVTNEDCIERALKKLRAPGPTIVRDRLVKANATLLKWLIEQERIDKIIGFPVLTANGVSEFRAGQLLLAPTAVWEVEAQPFADLFPDSRRLSDEYAVCLTIENWSRLKKAHLVLDSVFVVKPVETIDADHVDGPLTEDREHRSAAPLTTYDIEFLNGDDGVLAAVRKTKSRARKFLQFLLQHAAKAEPSWKSPPSFRCSCGDTHRLLPAWFASIRAYSWVPTTRTRSLPPTAESLATILDEELKRVIIGDSDHARLLLRLGIGISDVLRVGAPEERKFRLDQLSARMYATQSDTAIRCVEALLKNPEVAEAVLAKQLEIERVAHNMKIGTAVESLLRQELAHAGIDVTRTGVGSDFELETDFIENGQEQVIRINRYLLEIKSTTAPFVRMTLRQGFESIKEENRENYLLCVVELPFGEVTEQVVRENARFIFGIAPLVQSIVNDAQRLKALETTVSSTSSGSVGLEVIESSVKLRIGSDVWTTHGITLQQFVKRVTESEKTR